MGPALLSRSWTDNFLVYTYGTWLVWLLELVYCQLFVGLGLPAAQLRRRSGIIRGALRRPLCGWRLTRTGGTAAQSLLLLTALDSGDVAADAAAAAESDEADGDKADAKADMKPEAKAEAGEAKAGSREAAPAQPPQQQAGSLAGMNLSDALSGGRLTFSTRSSVPPADAGQSRNPRLHSMVSPLCNAQSISVTI